MYLDLGHVQALVHIRMRWISKFPSFTQNLDLETLIKLLLQLHLNLSSLLASILCTPLDVRFQEYLDSRKTLHALIWLDKEIKDPLVIGNLQNFHVL